MEKKLEAEHVLLITKEPLIFKGLMKILAKYGYAALVAESELEGIKLFQQHPVAVLICEHSLPDVNAVTIYQQTSQHSSTTAYLLLHEQQDTCVCEQIQDEQHAILWMSRPWSEETLLTALQVLLKQYKTQSENIRLGRLVFEQREELKRNYTTFKNELLLSAAIHQEMLTSPIPNNIPGVEIAALALPSSEIDGDFLEFYLPAEKIFDFALGDTMGKGVPAALLGLTVKTLITRFAMPLSHVQIYKKTAIWKEDLFSPHEILEQVDKTIGRQLNGLEYFVSLFYGRFDLNAQTFNFVNTGFPPFLYCRSMTKQIKEFDQRGPPIGVIEFDQDDVEKIDLSVGDVFLFYSDGVIEARSPTGEFFGISRLKQIIQNALELPSEQILNQIIHALLDFTQKKSFADDLTWVIVKIKELIPQSLKNVGSAKFSCDLSQLQAVRDFVGRICKRAPGDHERLSSQLQLVMNEVFSNLIQHAFQDSLQKGKESIVIEGFLESDGVRFEVSDRGTAIDPSQISEPSLSGDKESGFGWYMIRVLTDQLTYIPKQTEQGWNHLHIFKRYLTTEGQMNLSHTLQDNVLIITPEIENLDTKNAADFKQQVIELISTYENPKVVFDLHRLQFVDSSGLGSFLSILKALNKQGGDLKLSCLNRSTRATLEVVSLHKIFEIFNKNEEAIKSFK